jgi:hypothetical protein
VFSRDKTTREVDKPKRRVGRLLFRVVVVVLAAAIGLSYVRDVYRQEAVRHAIGLLSPFKVRAGGIGGWPLGNERIIWFERGSRLTDADAGALLGIASTTKGCDYVRLKLENTQITDKAVPILAGLDGINVLDVSGCPMTAQGARELQQKMHVTKVIRPAPEKH